MVVYICIVLILFLIKKKLGGLQYVFGQVMQYYIVIVFFWGGGGCNTFLTNMVIYTVCIVFIYVYLIFLGGLQ